MKTQLKRFFLTLGFMTRIPVNVNLGDVDENDMYKGFLYYPVIGLIIGLIDFAVYQLITLILPEFFGITFALLANFCVTGAFHLDGFCDTADGIYSARKRERMLEIMKDSRIGTNGALAMCFDLIIKFGGLMYSDDKALMILMMPIAGKMVQGALVYKAIYPRKKGIGIYVGNVSLGTTIGTMILGIIMMFAAFTYWGLLIFAILFFVAYLFRVYITGKIGGITGDVQGAGSEIAEMMLLLVTLVINNYTVMPNIIDLIQMLS